MCEKSDKGVDCKVKVCAENGTWPRLLVGRANAVCAEFMTSSKGGESGKGIGHTDSECAFRALRHCTVHCGQLQLHEANDGAGQRTA